MEKQQNKLQKDVIVSFKTVTNAGRNHFNGEPVEPPKKAKWLSVEVNEHKSEHGEMFSIDLNYREVIEPSVSPSLGGGEGEEVCD